MKKHSQLLKDFHLLLNVIIVIFHSTVFLVSTSYIVNNGYERAFLDRLSSLPTLPQHTFIQSIVLVLIIVGITKLDYFEEYKQKNFFLFYIEIVISIFLIFRLNGSYNGILLVVFADLFIRSKNIKNWIGMIILYSILHICTDYDLLSMFIKVPSIDVYINYLPLAQKSIILFFENLFFIINIVVFVVLLVEYLFEQEREKEDINKELSYLSQVNTQLENYAALSQKLGEDNERKRISREIHDTLGHALTGIAAGVDACIALIDIDKDKTKQQLKIVSKVVRQGIQDVRGSLNKLRPGALDDITFYDALKKMLKEFEEVSKLKIDFYYEWDDVDLEKSKEDIIYRIIQESITNALRHGHATEVEINMFFDAYKYMIIIQDNGIGCKDITYGYGLKQMQERILILNGKIEYKGDNGFRTIVEFRK